MLQRILSGKLPDKKQALRVAHAPHGLDPLVVEVCQRRLRWGPKATVAWLRDRLSSSPLERAFPIYTERASLQLAEDKVRMVLWDGTGDDRTVSNILEARLNGLAPDDEAEHHERFFEAFHTVMTEVFEQAECLELIHPEAIIKAASSVWSLKSRDFEKALRAKSRLGQWL